MAEAVYEIRSLEKHFNPNQHFSDITNRNRSALHLGALRITPGVPLKLTEWRYLKFRGQIMKMVLAGKLMVTMPNGTIIGGPAKAEPVVEAQPEPVSVEAVTVPVTPVDVATEPTAPVTELQQLTNKVRQLKRLENAGITTIQAVIEAGVTGLMEQAGLSPEAAEHIHATAVTLAAK
jgi:hypothetical protein